MYVENYHKTDEEILELFNALSLAWSENKEISVPKAWEPKYKFEKIKELGTVK